MRKILVKVFMCAMVFSLAVPASAQNVGLNITTNNLTGTQNAIYGAAHTAVGQDLSLLLLQQPVGTTRLRVDRLGNIEATGVVSSTQLCMGGVCQSSWSAVSGMTNPLTTTGDIIYGVGATPTRLAGAAGFLKSTGAAAPAWSALVASDIPSLDTTKITTGTFADARIASAATWNAKIGGSGTANYVSKFTAGSTLGSSIIYDNGTNIGIGTATPGYQLDMYKASSETGIRLNWGGNLFYVSHGGWLMGAGKLGIGDGSAPSIVIESPSRYVGIGTTDPAAALHVNGDAYFVGNVGINEANPNYSLDAVGGIRASNGFFVDSYTVIDSDGGWHRSNGATGFYFNTQGTGIRSPIDEGGNYGSVSTFGGEGGYEGYSIDGHKVLMSSGLDNIGLYDDADNEWIWYWLDGGDGRGSFGIGTTTPSDGKLIVETNVSGQAIRGVNDGTGYGVMGRGGFAGAYGDGSRGVQGYGSIYGIYGSLSAAGTSAVTGNAGANGDGVQGISTKSGASGVYGENGSGFGGYFTGGTSGVYAYSSAFPGVFNRPDDGVLIEFERYSAFAGSISVSGSTVSYNAFTGSHYAVIDKKVKIGTLISLTGDNNYLSGDQSSEIVYGTEPCAQINDPTVLGVYLGVSNPSQPASLSNPSLVAAVGNGDMLVVDKGENIKPGDFLISSDVAGYAMKDPGTFEISNVVAIAAEGIDWSKVHEKTVGGVKYKLISVFFEHFERANVEKINSKINDLKELVCFDHPQAEVCR